MNADLKILRKKSPFMPHLFATMGDQKIFVYFLFVEYFTRDRFAYRLVHEIFGSWRVPYQELILTFLVADLVSGEEKMV